MRSGKTLHELFNGAKDQTITGARTKKNGGVKKQLAHNPHREQKLFGDIFVDNYDEALVINKGSGENTCTALPFAP